MSVKAKTAVFLFTNTPQQESYLKAYAPNKTDSFTIAKKLYQHASNLIKQTGVDYYVIHSAKQVGTSFAERFANAFQTIFDKGYDHVISIGSDCPLLNIFILRESIRKIEAGNMVLGPTRDGGVYLVGLSKEHFNKEDFKSIHWQSDKVYGELRDSGSDKQQVIVFPTLIDADSEADIIQSIKIFNLNEVVLFIKDILFSIAKAHRTFITKSILLLPEFSFSLKAPPVVS